MTTPAGLLVVTDRHQAPVPLPEVVAAVVAAGGGWVLLREKDLPREERAALAAELRGILAPVGGVLSVAGPDPLDGDAVHLAAGDPLPAGVGLVGRSCHGRSDLERLTTEDYATVSPVFPSRSKPGYGPALGTARLAELCARAGRPVVALGGIETAERAAACLAAGAAAVAVMGEAMRTAGASVAAIAESAAPSGGAETPLSGRAS